VPNGSSAGSSPTPIWTPPALLTGALHEMALFGGSPSDSDDDALLRRVVRAGGRRCRSR